MMTQHALKLLIVLSLVAVVFGQSTATAADKSALSRAGRKLRVYFGTYTRGEGKGIYVSELDTKTGRLSKARLAGEAVNMGCGPLGAAVAGEAIQPQSVHRDEKNIGALRFRGAASRGRQSHRACHGAEKVLAHESSTFGHRGLRASEGQDILAWSQLIADRLAQLVQNRLVGDQPVPAGHGINRALGFKLGCQEGLFCVEGIPLGIIEPLGIGLSVDLVHGVL